MNLTPPQLNLLLHNLNGYLPCTPYGSLSELAAAVAGSEAGGCWLLWFWTRLLLGTDEIVMVAAGSLPPDLDRSDGLVRQLSQIGLTQIRHNLGGQIELSFRQQRAAFIHALARALDLSDYQTVKLFKDARRMERNDYYLSPQWSARRWQVIQRAGGRCEKCRKAAAWLQAHHLTYKHFGEEPLEDLQALCGKCHQAVHNRTDKQRPAGKAVARNRRVAR